MTIEVNQKLLPMKAHYFFFNAGTAPVVPFMPTFARQLGFSTVVVGTVYTILPILGLLVKPVFGFVADRFRIRKSLFLFCQLLTAVAFLGIMFIQPVEQTGADIQFHCNDGVSDLRYCPADSGADELNACEVAPLIGDNVANTGATMTCTMRCHTNETWQSAALCGGPNVSANCAYELTAHIKMTHLELVDKCLMFVPHDVQIRNASGTPQTLTCPHDKDHPQQYMRSRCDSVRCDDAHVQQLLAGPPSVTDQNAWSLPQFWAFFLCMVFSWIGMAVVVSLSDAICFHMLGDRPNLYGQQRLWGAVGWGIFALLAGLLVDEMSRGRVLKDYSGVFYMMVALMALDLAFSSRLRDEPTAMAADRTGSMLRDVAVLFAQPAVCVFFVWCIVIGLGTALVWNFLFWHLENLDDRTCATTEWMKTLQGIAMGIQCFAGEIPFFFLSGKVLKRIGHVHAMSLVLLAFGVRFLLYSVLTNPWWVLPIETMQGVTFGIFMATMTSYASIVAPPGTESTLQGLVGAVFEGIGVSLGSLIGGHMIDSLGGSVTFRVFGAAAMVLFVVHVVVQRLLEKCACSGGGKTIAYGGGDGTQIGGRDGEVVVVGGVNEPSDGERIKA